MKNKLQNTQQFNKELKGTNQSQNETLKKVHKQQWSRRGFLKGTLIGVSALVISVFSHSLLKPESNPCKRYSYCDWLLSRYKRHREQLYVRA
jgi:hypothetical protein